MESQKVERRDSKKSNKGGGIKNQGRGGGGSSSGGNGSGSSNGKPSGEKQRSHSQKSGKPYREIYKPPSLRSSKNRSSVSSNEGSSKNEENLNQTHSKKNGSNPSSKGGNGQSKSIPSSQQFDDLNSESQNGYSLFGNSKSNGGGNANGSNSSVPSSPLLSSRMQNSLNYELAKRFNVDAKEFQFLPMQHQQQQQQLSKFLSQFDPSLFYNVNTPILQSAYPLKQSKSSGSMNFLHQQQVQAQAAALQQLQTAIGLGLGNLAGAAATPMNPTNGMNQHFNRLSQSKSSGNVPGAGKPRVRFDDEDQDYEEDGLGLLSSLKLNGDVAGISPNPNFSNRFAFQQQKPNSYISPGPAKPALHKSRTGFYLNMQGNQQHLVSPTTNLYNFGNAVAGNPSGATHSPVLGHINKFGNSGHQFTGATGGITNVVKRSKSFGPDNHHVPRIPTTSFFNASPHGSSSSSGHSIYSDFCLKSWPKTVQVLVTDAVVGVERIPTRNWIEMVNGIFEAMLCNYRPTKTEKLDSASGSKVADFNKSDYDEEDEDEDETDLTTAAVHIFLYFIQKEKDKKDRIVMESLLNTCFAYFQRLSSNDKKMTSMAQNFLRFLSTLYSQVKLRHKQSQQQPGMDEMSFSLLALLADFIAILIRSPPSDEMMGYLFTVLTSHGRDIEFFHPLKMKRLLAGVRDVLLGIGPYYQQQQGNKKSFTNLSPMVQKTLMQLIELHASNWQLCASQVSYYHCKSTNPANTTNNPFYGNIQSQARSQRINHGNSSSIYNTTTFPSPASPSPSTSAESNVSNDAIDANDNGNTSALPSDNNEKVEEAEKSGEGNASDLITEQNADGRNSATQK